MGWFSELLVMLGMVREKEIYYIGGSDVLPPPLKGLEEQQALEALERGEEEARQTLVEHNLRLVVYIARRFENTGINLEDLISIGTIGLKTIFRQSRRLNFGLWKMEVIKFLTLKTSL